MASSTLMTFFIASLLLALTPGPDNLFVITHSVLRGWKAGFAVVLGVCTGLLFHTSAVALGIAVVLETSPWAFITLKVIGAGYLLYLAWQAFTASVIKGSEDGQDASGFWSYRRGIIMNVTNPKVSLFFLAFLPQFVPPTSEPVSLYIALLGALFAVATIIVFGTMALLADRVSKLLTESEAVQKRLNKVAAVVFIALAVHLLLGL